MHRHPLRVRTVSSTDVVVFGTDTRRAGRWLWLWAGGLWYSQQDQRSDRRWPAYCWTERSGELILACWLLQQWPMSHVKWKVIVNKTENNFFPTWLVWIDSLTSFTHTAWKTKLKHFKYPFIFSSEMSGVELVSQSSNFRSQTSDVPTKKEKVLVWFCHTCEDQTLNFFHPDSVCGGVTGDQWAPAEHRLSTGAPMLVVWFGPLLLLTTNTWLILPLHNLHTQGWSTKKGKVIKKKSSLCLTKVPIKQRL